MNDKQITQYVKSVAITFGIILGIALIHILINQIVFGNYPEWGWEAVFLFVPIGALIVTAITIGLFLFLTLFKSGWRTAKNLYIFAIVISLILVAVEYTPYDPWRDWFLIVSLIVGTFFTVLGLNLLYPGFIEKEERFPSNNRYTGALRFIVPGIILLAYVIWRLAQ